MDTWARYLTFSSCVNRCNFRPEIMIFFSSYCLSRLFSSYSLDVFKEALSPNSRKTDFQATAEEVRGSAKISALHNHGHFPFVKIHILKYKATSSNLNIKYYTYPFGGVELHF